MSISLNDTMVTTQLSIRFIVQANFTTEVTWRLIISTVSDFDSFMNERMNNLYIPHADIGLKADTNKYEVIRIVDMKSELYGKLCATELFSSS
eukprot:scaffold61963_cov49-Attheya_sp.AAC.3